MLEIRSPDLEACSIAFTDCDQTVTDLTAILRGWDIREARASHEAAVIRLERTTRGYLRVSPWSKTPAQRRKSFRTHDSDALFGVHYDLLRWYVDAQRARPCLHSAATMFASGLVVFPNTTKAGKSTLTIQLAMAGHQVFCDDWLSIDPAGNAGMALGILPWLRLPPPREAREDFKRFLKPRRGPGNRRWMYVDLRERELAPHGATAPIAGLVLLDRRPDARARLTSVAKDTMLSELIQQNYATQAPAADMFDMLHALTRSADCCRLEYASVREAATLLQGVFGGPGRVTSETARTVPSAANSKAEAYRRVGAVSTRQVGETTYLLDVRHNAIHQLNPLGRAIWELLARPTNINRLVSSLHLAFADIDHSVIEQDVRTLLDRFVDAGLVNPCGLARSGSSPSVARARTP